MAEVALEDIQITTRTVVQHGIQLPWERWSYPAVFKDGKNLTPDRPHPSVLEDSGEVFIPIDTLYELSEQGPWDSQFGSALLLGVHEGLALTAAGLARQETRGGFYGTDLVKELIKRVEEASISG